MGFAPSAEPCCASFEGGQWYPARFCLVSREGDKQFEHYVVWKQPKIQKEYENVLFFVERTVMGWSWEILHACFEDIQSVPLPTKPGSSLIILLQTHSDTYRHFTTDTFLFISHTTNVLLFKLRCNIFIGFGIIKELPGLVGSGTPYTMKYPWLSYFSFRALRIYLQTLSAATNAQFCILYISLFICCYMFRRNFHCQEI